MSADGSAPRSSVSVLRLVIVWVIVASFALAAVGGIIVLLGGRLGQTGSDVVATTAIVGAFSVAILCCASVIGKRQHSFGLVGVVVALATLAYSLGLVWEPFTLPVGAPAQQALITGIATTAAFSLASLLLLLADRRRPAVRVGLRITLVLFAIVLAITILQVWSYEIWADDFDYDRVQRVWGVFGILAALGAIVVPVMSLLLPDSRPSSGRSEDDVVQRLTAEADRRGVTVEQLVAPLLTSESPPVSGDHPA